MCWMSASTLSWPIRLLIALEGSISYISGSWESPAGYCNIRFCCSQYILGVQDQNNSAKFRAGIGYRPHSHCCVEETSCCGGHLHPFQASALEVGTVNSPSKVQICENKFWLLQLFYLAVKSSCSLSNPALISPKLDYSLQLVL